jgi:uncharacterized membrane protein YfcA
VTITTHIVLFFAAALGGALNSVVGGATFVIFPALVFAGVPAISANATSSVVVWPAALASVFAYREDLKLDRRLLVALGIASLAGGGLGAWLLLRTPGAAFARLVPWLLLFATLLFSFGGALSKRFISGTPGSYRSAKALAGVTLAQLAISVYGGYFGAGMRILMLAAYALANFGSINTMNGVRSLLGLAINGVAIAWFIIHGAITWKPAIVMVVGAAVTGYAGAAIARRVNPLTVKRLVMAVAWGMTVYFFVRTYVRS